VLGDAVVPGVNFFDERVRVQPPYCRDIELLNIGELFPQQFLDPWKSGIVIGTVAVVDSTNITENVALREKGGISGTDHTQLRMFWELAKKID
jgi:hypothetical protein